MEGGTQLSTTNEVELLLSLIETEFSLCCTALSEEATTDLMESVVRIISAVGSTDIPCINKVNNNFIWVSSLLAGHRAY